MVSDNISRDMNVENIRSESLWLDEEVKTTKSNLEKALAVCNRANGNIEDDDSNSAGGGPILKKGTDQVEVAPEAEREAARKRYVKHKMKVRFQDIFAQLDALIAVTRISVQDLVVLTASSNQRLSDRMFSTFMA